MSLCNENILGGGTTLIEVCRRVHCWGVELVHKAEYSGCQSRQPTHAQHFLRRRPRYSFHVAAHHDEHREHYNDVRSEGNERQSLLL